MGAIAGFWHFGYVVEELWSVEYGRLVEDYEAAAIGRAHRNSAALVDRQGQTISERRVTGRDAWCSSLYSACTRSFGGHQKQADCWTDGTE